MWKYQIYYTKVDINCNLNSFKVLFGNYLEKYLNFFFKNTNWLTKWGLSADIKWMNNNFTLRFLKKSTYIYSILNFIDLLLKYIIFDDKMLLY